MNKYNLKIKQAAKKRRARLLAGFARSGMSITDFAKLNGISRQRMSLMLKEAVSE